MRMTRLFGMLGLVSLLAVQIAGCASTTKLTSKQLCEASGGTYTAKSCTPGKTMKAEQMCFAAGGTYDFGSDTCEMGGERSK